MNFCKGKSLLGHLWCTNLRISAPPPSPLLKQASGKWSWSFRLIGCLGSKFKWGMKCWLVKRDPEATYRQERRVMAYGHLEIVCALVQPLCRPKAPPTGGERAWDEARRARHTQTTHHQHPGTASGGGGARTGTAFQAVVDAVFRPVAQRCQ